MGKTNIAWCDETDNVIVILDKSTGEQAGWYCQKRSPGCQNCFAEAINVSGRFNGNGLPYVIPKTGARTFDEVQTWLQSQGLELSLRRDILDKWHRKTAPKRRFINSMTDTFGEFVPNSWIWEILEAQFRAPSHQTFLNLTKRVDRMRDILFDFMESHRIGRMPGNMQFIASASNQEWLEKRIEPLTQLPATIGLSLEPLIGPIDLSKLEPFWVDWIIIGGESGPNARPFNLDWIGPIIDYCAQVGIACFVKQMGSNSFWPVDGIDGYLPLTFSGKGENMDEWPEQFQVREYPVPLQPMTQQELVLGTIHSLPRGVR